jgi:hypothetical protein
MRIRRVMLLGMLVGSLVATGCAHAAYGPSSDARLDSAVKEGAAPDRGMKDVTTEQIAGKKCSNYRERLAKAKNTEGKEEDQLDAYMSLFKELKSKNEFVEQALAANPDLQFQNDSQAPKIHDECVQALAEVRQDYYALVIDISDVLVVKDTKGAPAARLDFKKFRESITVLDPDDREALLSRVDAAERKIKSRND